VLKNESLDQICSLLQRIPVQLYARAGILLTFRKHFNLAATWFVFTLYIYYCCCPTKSERKKLEINILIEKTLIQNS
jgi:hypothetical protein